MAYDGMTPAKIDGPLARLHKRWRTYTGDRDLELAIRVELRQRGLKAQAARILDTRLGAIERPGWVQVYRFFVEGERQDDNSPCRLFGVARLDERNRGAVMVFDYEQQREAQFDVWAEGLVRSRQHRRTGLEKALIGVGLTALALAVLTAIFSGG